MIKLTSIKKRTNCPHCTGYVNWSNWLNKNACLLCGKELKQEEINIEKKREKNK